MTAQEMIRRTLRLAGILADGQTPTAEMYSDGLQSLNEMLSAWRDQGVDLGHISLSMGDELPYQDDHLAAIRYSLVIEISPEYAAPLRQEVVMLQQKYFRALQALYCNPPFLRIDCALSPYYTQDC
jgi:hypothetical protein